MSKYIPAVFADDKHFSRSYYTTSSDTFSDYQSALTKASELAHSKRSEEPITRVDGFEYPKPTYRPAVLKEVIMVEAKDE